MLQVMIIDVVAFSAKSFKLFTADEKPLKNPIVPLASTPVGEIISCTVKGNPPTKTGPLPLFVFETSISAWTVTNLPILV